MIVITAHRKPRIHLAHHVHAAADQGTCLAFSCLRRGFEKTEQTPLQFRADTRESQIYDSLMLGAHGVCLLG